MKCTGVDDRGNPYIGQYRTGRDIAENYLHQETKPETLLSNIAFGVAVTFSAFLFFWWMRGMFVELFVFTWKSFAGNQ